jgi:DNA-binding PadR family transcriptional regulator
MGRWDIDDPGRHAGGPAPSSAERPHGAHRGHDLRIEPLPDRVEGPSPDCAQRGPDHQLTLPSGWDRERVRLDASEYRLRGSEVELLERTGRFRAVFTDDLKRAVSDPARFRDDLRSLQRQGLIDERTVTRLRGATVAEVLALTDCGRDLLDRHRSSASDVGQVYYGGWVKPAEIWHDASLFRMVGEVEHELDREGACVQRVVLDDELKAQAFRDLYEARYQGMSDRDAHRVVAARVDLPLDDGHFVFPDVRLEVRLADGTVRTVDLELVTGHYHRGHLGGKAAGGFRMFEARSSGGAKGGPPHDPRVTGKLL